MNENFFRFILIPLIVLTVSVLARFIRNKFAKPKYEDNIQKPGKFDGCLQRIIQTITVISGIFAVLGLIAGEMEMGIVFSVMTLIFLGIIFLLKREYNLTYEENEEYFVLNHKNKEHKVYYENIVDWLPSFNEISILDKTKEDQKYIKVNVAMIKPEILLRKIAEMTFDGKFPHRNHLDPNDPDPMREHEIINFLNGYDYGYLVEDLESQL